MAKKYLVVGKGFLGEKIADYFQAVISEKMISSLADARQIIRKYQPDVLINCAGITGRPNIDWCEDHKEETMFGNYTLPLLLAQACKEAKVTMVHLGSGCVYDGDNHGKGFSETDPPNFTGSFYSITKLASERALTDYDNVLQVRLRMPIDSTPSGRNFITKITSYSKVINARNSVTIIDDLLYAIKQLLAKKQHGIFNVTNPGTISHNEILTLYKKIVDPQFKWQSFSVTEMHKLTKAKRSNCVLNTAKLNKIVKLKPIKARMVEVLKEYKKHL